MQENKKSGDRVFNIGIVGILVIAIATLIFFGFLWKPAPRVESTCVLNPHEVRLTYTADFGPDHIEMTGTRTVKTGGYAVFSVTLDSLTPRPDGHWTAVWRDRFFGSKETQTLASCLW